MFTLVVFRMENMIHRLNCGGSLVKLSSHILQLCLFSRDDLQKYFSLFCLYTLSLFSILVQDLLLLQYLDWNAALILHIFSRQLLWGLKRNKAKQLKGFPLTLPGVQLLPPLKHLASASLRTAEIGEMWVCFRLRGFSGNYGLTVDLWWVYGPEVSYSWCITGKA